MLLAGSIFAALFGVTAEGRAAQSPGGRGYELVSPADKNGADVMADTARTRAAANGDGVAFASLGGFGDVKGTGVAVDYLSERDGTPGTSGWVTHAITPRQEALTAQGVVFGRDPLFEGDFSPDLSSAVYRAWRPLTDAPNVAQVVNLYGAHDLSSAGAQTVELLTDAFAPLGGGAFNIFYRPWLAGASTDQRHVIFESARQLTPDATPGTVNLYESVDGSTRLVGILPDGTPTGGSQAGMGAANTFYTSRMISADGRRILFTDTTTGNIYVRIDGTTTEQLNASEKPDGSRESPQPATLWTASDDGTKVFFTTSEGLVAGDDDGVNDVYMYDANAPAGHRLTLVSVDTKHDGHSVQTVVGASADGHYVYFVSAGQLIAGQPSLAIGLGLYVWHDGTLDLIGEFAEPSNVALNGAGASWGFWARTSTARVSPDGRDLLFMATNDAGFAGRHGFGGYDHGSSCTFDNDSGGPCRELYVYRADTGRLACASCDPTGAVATGDALVHIRAGVGVTSTTWHLSHALSDDGRRVFFNTVDALVPEDSNGKMDAYEYDIDSGTVQLVSSGKDPSDSYFLDASPNGRDVFFVTRQRLVGWDTDDSYDMYDARIGGGFPEPVPVPPGCIGDTCRGQESGAPPAAAPASAAFSGKGNARGRLVHRHKRKHCRRGTVLRRVRGRQKCVRRHATRSRVLSNERGR